MASFRAVRTMGDLPLAARRDDDSSDSSSSEDSPSEGSSSLNRGDDARLNSQCAESSASTSASGRAPMRGGLRQLRWLERDEAPRTSFVRANGDNIAQETRYFGRELCGAQTVDGDKIAQEAPRSDFAPLRDDALAQEVHSNPGRSSTPLCKKQLRARFASNPTEQSPAQAPAVHKSQGSRPTSAVPNDYFQCRTEGSLPAIDLDDLRSAVRASATSSSSTSFRKGERANSKQSTSSLRRESVETAEPPWRRSMDPLGAKRPGPKQACSRTSRSMLRESSFELEEPSGEQEKPRVPAEEERTRRSSEVEDGRLFSSTISSEPITMDPQPPQQSLLCSILRSKMEEAACRESRESRSMINISRMSFTLDEEPPSPMRPVSRTTSRHPSVRIEKDVADRLVPTAPSAGAPRVTTPAVPQVVPSAPPTPSGRSAPSAPSRPARRLRRPIRRGWGSESKGGSSSSQVEPQAGPQAEGADGGEQEEREQHAAPSELIHPIFDAASTSGGEAYRATFADHQARAREGPSLEYRPRIKFLNILSSVTASVHAYVEAVAQEVCKAVLGTRVFVLFADDVREQVFCTGLGDVACNMRWKGGIAGNIVKDGVQGRFGHSDDQQFTKLMGCDMRSYLCTPIRHMLDQGRNIGGIVAINKIGAPGAEFTDSDLKVLQDISRLASDSFYRQRWKALENASSKGDSEALALISSTKPKLEKQDLTPRSAGPENQAKMDLLTRRVSWVELPVEVRTAKVSKLQSLGFDALEHSPEELLSFVEVVMQHTGCVEGCAIPLERLRNWACGAKWKYHDNPFHNWFHGFSVFQMCYYQLAVSPLQELFTTLDVFGLMIASLCHDLDHPGFTNNFMVDSQSELALRHNDIAVLENHHASLACELLRRDATAIGAGLDAAAQKSLRRVIIKCILDTDMAHHSEMCQKLLASGGTEDRQLMLGACIHSSDLSGQTLPWKTAKKWEERISMEFTRQAAAELVAGRSPAPFMSFQMDDVKQRGKLQRDFCDFVLLPLWDPYTQQLPALRPCYRNLVKNRSFYEHRWNTGEDPDPQWYK